jgi:alpha-ketoglutarate-dependent taurine dioxygenase
MMGASGRGPIRDPNAWLQSDFPVARAWVRPLDTRMLAELDGAMRRAAASGAPFWQWRREDFPLPETAPLIGEVVRDLESGPGFAILAGVPVGRYDRDQNLALFAVVGAHLGRVVDQTANGSKVEDIIDRGLPMDRKTRGYMGTHGIGFHTDGSDFAGLFCLETAAAGGQSVLVSATSVYNTLLAERPDLLAVLERGFYHHRRGEEARGEPPVTRARIPVFQVHEGLVHCCYNRNPPEWLEAAGLRYEPAEVEALDYLDSVLARPELQLQMELRPGDMQFVNNYNILHGRTGYRDTPGRKRHLLRLWFQGSRCRRRGDNIIDLYAPWDGKRRDPD